MSVRAPILPVAFLAAAVLAIVLPGDPAGLLLLTPALTVLLPLLASAYPGERSVAKLASWLSRVRVPDTAGSVSLALDAAFARPACIGFTAANGSRGPPLLLA
jgi:hypothetical protein